MSLKRVVITGVGSVSPLGYGSEELWDGLQRGICATKFLDEWATYGGMRSLVGAPLELRDERNIPRKFRRTMSPMSIYAAQAVDQALADSGIERGEVADNPRVGAIMGHTTGSPITLTETYKTLLPQNSLSMLTASAFFQCLSHTVVFNLAQYLGLTGVVMATSAACASGLQAIGAGYDLVQLGRQDIMLCGGAEELHPTVTGSFDILDATSYNYNDTPSMTPRPFDAERDGLVCGEGGGVVLLEEYERAKKRGAKIYCEITGYATCGNGTHVSQSDPAAMVLCMENSMADAKIGPEDIDFVNAHATGTAQGDAAEVEAIAKIFGDRPPVTSFKGSLGHTLGASGPIELIVCLEMMRRGRILPTHNLDIVAPDCEGVRHVQTEFEQPIKRFLKNSFAFGGINAAVVCEKI